jgi:hypothetical protein
MTAVLLPVFFVLILLLAVAVITVTLREYGRAALAVAGELRATPAMRTFRHATRGTPPRPGATIYRLCFKPKGRALPFQPTRAAA